MPDFDVTTIDGLLGAVAEFDRAWLRERPDHLGRQPYDAPHAEDEIGAFNGTYCTCCGDFRRMLLRAADDRCAHLNPRYVEATKRILDQFDDSKKVDRLAYTVGTPAPIFVARCLQCETRLSLVIEAGPPTEVVVLGSQGAGFSTRHSPPTVRFYLDQAYRSRTRGAFTAAVAMYRSALEQLLRHQGFEARTLSGQIQAAVAASPPWLQHMDQDSMGSLRQLGNDAVHLGDRDVGEQADRDRRLTHDVEQIFVEALDEIYERPAQRLERKRRFEAAKGPGQEA